MLTLTRTLTPSLTLTRCCGGPCPKAGDDGAPLAASSAVYHPERSGSLLVEEPGQNASAVLDAS